VLTPDREKLKQVVCKEQCVDAGVLQKSERGIWNGTWNVGIYSFRPLRGEGLDEICGKFGLKRYGSAGSVGGEEIEMFKEEREKLQFEWSHLGDINLGRRNLGPMTSVAIYRLMQFTLRDAAIKHCGAEMATKIFYDAGFNSGKAIYENLLDSPKEINELVSRLQKTLKDLNIGILRMEEVDLEDLKFTLTVSEDLDCSGLPLMEEAICTFDEGLIAGILELFTGSSFEVKEVDCWCTGDRVCRFQANVTVNAV